MDALIHKNDTVMPDSSILRTSNDSSILTPFTRDRFDSTGRFSRRLGRKHFINRINHLHFIDGTAYAVIEDLNDRREYLLNIRPDPCCGSTITFVMPEDFLFDTSRYLHKGVVVNDGKSVIMMPSSTVTVTGNRVTAGMEERAYVFTARQSARSRCSDIITRIHQGDILITGMLDDFSPDGLRVRFSGKSADKLSLLDTGRDVTVYLFHETRPAYSGSCRVIRSGRNGTDIIFRPLTRNTMLFKERSNRNPRLKLVPTPKVLFRHPLNDRQMQFEIYDLTNSGFSIHDYAGRLSLLPGMAIHDAEIVFPGGQKMKCSAHVIYIRKKSRNAYRYGFAIFDMDVITYNRLFDVFSNASDMHANVSPDLDMGALWEFFFTSNFIYPKKYHTLSGSREEFKETYRKLYQDSPEVFANFTYRENGVIYGHVSIIKAYETTWMIHHLAARPMGRKRTGLYVLNHILNYFDGFYRMPSIGMEHMIFYFRPDNRFPDYFFGGFCREFNNPRGCSMDLFAYLTVSKPKADPSLPSPWTLEPCSSEDYGDLKEYYRLRSGGLMIDAFCLDRPGTGAHSISTLFARSGLRRRYSAWALRRGITPVAFLIIDESDAGINLSDLLNSIKVIVRHDADVPWNILEAAIGLAGRVYSTELFPVMVYPHEYLDDRKIPYDKQYNLWVLNARYGDEYTEHLKKKASIRITKLLFKYLVSKITGK